ncbi:MAG: ATP-dependent DNA ligase, partial [Pseudomonadota bacterium]
MKPFAELLDRLVLTPSRNGKLRLLVDYVRTTPDPDRGYAIAAITRDLDIPSVKPAMIRGLVEERVDPVLFGYSYDFVGDMAETISLIWPAENESQEYAALSLSQIVETLQNASRSEGPKLVEAWLDQLDDQGRYALIKLITGGLRIGVSSRLIKQALADYGDKDVNEIEELWHGLEVPFLELFAWLDGKAQKPESAAASPFRPAMLATPTDADELGKYLPEDYAAEWKWDGIRVQVTCERGVPRIYSRTGDDISHSFPDLLAAMDFEGSLDGELLVARSGDAGIEVGTFGDLQQRLNRKTV